MSEKIAAMIEEIKALSVLELSELVWRRPSVFPPLPSPQAPQLLPALLRRRRPSLTWL